MTLVYPGHAALGNSRVPCRNCFTAEDGMDGVGGALVSKGPLLSVSDMLVLDLLDGFIVDLPLAVDKIDPFGGGFAHKSHLHQF